MSITAIICNHVPFRAITVIIPLSSDAFSIANPAPVSMGVSESGAIRIIVYFPGFLSQSPRLQE
jgi:hypothetical protein